MLVTCSGYRLTQSYYLASSMGQVLGLRPAYSPLPSHLRGSFSPLALSEQFCREAAVLVGVFIKLYIITTQPGPDTLFFYAARMGYPRGRGVSDCSRYDYF